MVKVVYYIKRGIGALATSNIVDVDEFLKLLTGHMNGYVEIYEASIGTTELNIEELIKVLKL
jgi:hypothetical protein